jgi:protein-tyrosine phosphatase
VLGPALHQQLAAKATVALTCSFGAGRSGTIAALLLNEQGRPMFDAIRDVRAGFQKAIESAVQEQWLRARVSVGKPATRW